MGTNSGTATKLPFAWVFLLAPFGIVGTSFVFLVLGVIARGDPAPLIEDLGFTSIRSFSMLAYVLVSATAVLVLYILLKRAGMGMKDVGFRGRFSSKATVYAFIAFAIAWTMYPVTEFILGKLGLSMYWDSGREAPLSPGSVFDGIATFISAVILAPLTEDTLFRGYMLSMFRQRYSSITAVLLSAVIFAALHLPFFGPGLAIYMLPWTLISCYLFLKFDDLYSAMLFHVTNNLAAYIIYPLTSS